MGVSPVPGGHTEGAACQQGGHGRYVWDLAPNAVQLESLIDAGLAPRRAPMGMEPPGRNAEPC
jgi:hypothetical protein